MYLYDLDEKGYNTGEHTMPLDEVYGLRDMDDNLLTKEQLLQRGVFVDDAQMREAAAQAPEGYTVRWRCNIEAQTATPEYTHVPYFPPPSPLVQMRSMLMQTMGMDEEAATEQVLQLAEENNFVDPTAQGYWNPGAYIAAGTEILYTDGKRYRVLVNLVMMEIYPPHNTPTLYVAVREDWEPWKKPEGAHDVYRVGDKVTHKGKRWICTGGDAGGNNSWEPGEYGWTEQAQ